MTSRRIAKASEAIRESVATTILIDLKDPRVKNVTVLRAEAAPDMRTAKVYISVMGTPKEQSLCLHGLESARGFIQSKLADRMQTRYTPVLRFVLDPAVKKSIETSRLLREALPHDSAEDADDETFDGDEWNDDVSSDSDASTDDASTDDVLSDDVLTNAEQPDSPADSPAE